MVSHKSNRKGNEDSDQ